LQAAEQIKNSVFFVITEAALVNHCVAENFDSFELNIGNVRQCHCA